MACLFFFSILFIVKIGLCDVADGADLCFVNCGCAKCPAGKASSDVGATSEEVCSWCGAGQISGIGDTSKIGCYASF